MILMISSEGDHLESQPCHRFGRAPYFIQFDLSEKTWKAHSNEAVHERGGAGVASTQFLVDHKADVVVSGRFGPNAYRALSSAGVQLFAFDARYETVQQVIEAYKNQELIEVGNEGLFQ